LGVESLAVLVLETSKSYFRIGADGGKTIGTVVVVVVVPPVAVVPPTWGTPPVEPLPPVDVLPP
jgi:hypothetical protein